MNWKHYSMSTFLLLCYLVLNFWENCLNFDTFWTYIMMDVRMNKIYFKIFLKRKIHSASMFGFRILCQKSVMNISSLICMHNFSKCISFTYFISDKGIWSSRMEKSLQSLNKKWHLVSSETFGSPSKASLSYPSWRKVLPTKSRYDQSYPQHLNLKISDKLIKRILNFWSKSNYWAILKSRGLESQPQSWKVPNDLQGNTV